ncbi:MAG: 3-isopropylmalate dehydratase small subunit [Spirochaetaceae bacterium]
MSDPVFKVEGRGIPIRGNDIDTDQIIPARFMKCVTFDGLGEYAFFDVRYDDKGNRKDHPFNDERYEGASILVVNSNFGCGSSREHAPQALAKWGIKAIIGESYAEIFAGNCVAMGIPAIELSHEAVEEVLRIVEEDPSREIRLLVPEQVVQIGRRTFEGYIPPAYRNSLSQGTWDSTSVLLDKAEEIDKVAARLPYVSGY